MSKNIYTAKVDNVWIGSKNVDLTNADQKILKIIYKHAPSAVSKSSGGSKKSK